MDKPQVKPPIYMQTFPTSASLGWFHSSVTEALGWGHGDGEGKTMGLAVVHADHTLRPQTVKKDFAPRYWNLINEFGKLTGEPLLLNTSFNVMGEPIVNHPREAIRCFYDNGLDVLVLDNFVIEKMKA